VVENAIEPALLERMRAGIEKITADPDSFPPRLKRHLDFERTAVTRRPGINELSPEQVGNALRNVMELPLFDPVFAELICYKPVLDVLEALFRTSEFAFHNYKCIIKAPRVSSKFVWHRDLPYLQHSTPNLITAMLCLDPTTAARYAYQDLMPASKDPARQRQVRMTFPHLLGT
jgi:hypothetical protein